METIDGMRLTHMRIVHGACTVLQSAPLTNKTSHSMHLTDFRIFLAAIRAQSKNMERKIMIEKIICCPKFFWTLNFKNWPSQQSEFVRYGH